MNKINSNWKSIEPKSHILDIKIKELWDYRDLLFIFIKRDISVIYKQTILGPLWFFIQPILTTFIYVFVFGNIANISTDDIPKPLFYLSGIVLWNYFSDCFLRTSETFIKNAEVFGKVYFPRLISPLSIILSNALKFLIQFFLFIGLYLCYYLSNYDINPNYKLIYVPILFLIMGLIGLGFGLIFSSLTTKYKDLKFLIQFGVQLLMYATPIIYPLSTLSEKYQYYLWFNPITHIMEAFKYGFLGQGVFSINGLIYSSLFTLVILFVGVIIFNKTEKTFMDTV